MHQKYVISLIVFFLLLSNSTPVLAVDEITSSPSAAIQKTDRKNLRDTFQADKKSLQATLAVKRDELKEKLLLLKDTRKKATVERINTKLPNMNEKATTRMSEAVTKLTAIVTRLKTETTTLKSQGIDTTQAANAILSAEQALASASAAIATQQAKQYTLTIESEQTLRTTIGPTVKQMQADLRATHATVITARRAVYVAKMTVQQLKPNRALGTGTPTPSGIPTATSSATE